ncbi:MAG: sulfite exporter TauE/SafE family protein [Candidatus Nomurabacteria bacterium]|nr:sulfite exporter TauE/SafE family protein [Candidatus Nomurabacteria bacterium]USN87954.1 MAG: sulfite exporter TauE/SafE family protein [Candidatus Nomurabacteria bacterium]
MNTEILVYILLGFSSFFFVVVPMSAAVVLNPLLSLIVEPHTAIGLVAFFFMVNSLVKTIVFRKDVLPKYIKKMLPISIVMAMIGTYVVSLVSSMMLLVLIFIMSAYFLLKKIYEMYNVQERRKNIHEPTLVIVSIISGFMQGTGLGAGGALRKVYLLSENISLQQMHGTTSLISFVVLSLAFLVRLETEQLTLDQVIPIVYIVPIITVATLFGKKVLGRLSKKTADVIGIIAMLLITVFLGVSLF